MGGFTDFQLALMKSICVKARGGSEVLVCQDSAKPKCSPDQVLLKVTAAGINFADIMQHLGTYPLQLPLPYTPGMESIGIVEEVGAMVTTVKVGDRVAALSFAGGGYAEFITVAPDQIIYVPDEVDEHTVLALSIQGVTAHLLLSYSAKLRKGDRVLIHAAAGGVGNLLVQLSKLMGAGHVFGTAGTAAKRKLIKRQGVDYPIDYTKQDWHEDILALTEGQGVDVILDPVGDGATMQNLACLDAEGRLVSYGWLSGSCLSLNSEQCQQLLFKNQNVSGFAVNVVMERHPDIVRATLEQLFEWVETDKLKPTVSQVFALEDAAQAHAAISARKTTGKVILRM